MNIAELINEIKAGSRAAQKVLFDHLSDRMLMVCCRYVKSREDAEEMMLNGFYKLFRNLHGFQFLSEPSFYAWVKRLMVNECLMFLRKKHVFTMVSETAALEIRLNEDILDRLSAAAIFELILQLPVGYRTIFNLYELEGYNHQEIASMLDISPGTSKSQLSKAKVLLQKMIIQNETYGTQRKVR
ncbi:RNA polymerase sigma factor [Flavihumibacter petaseus]|uniref:Putative RNA polymerase ECF-type sigma factor n=1 Tax=Flavihumibacter petaseus NBRC 106054 TaxID=1220578 RepID=A0A0E9N4X8_9BACT|nr:RNA polymerase sigma factor [Flavihumibacter petaseus]GAO45017.1 putative RNA polymerase ECF-type sigma factor [Flavihumibacter petaseus NBRC 106054]